MRFCRRALCAIALAGIMSGCAPVERHALFPVPRSSTHVVWAAAPFAAVTPAGVRYGGVGQNQDYLLYRAHGMQAELVFINALGFQRAIRYRGSLQRLARTWAINRHAGLAWGGKRTVRSPLAAFTVQRYRLKRLHRRCAALQARWDFPSGVARDWPGKLLFGYVCAAPKRALRWRHLQALLDGLGLRYTRAPGAPATLPRLDPTPTPARPGGTAHGNAHFPFLFSIYHPGPGGHGSHDGAFH